MEEENEKPCLKDKILELGCFGYKGGELSTPYMYDSIEDFIVSSVRVWDKLYIKNRDHGNETGEKLVGGVRLKLVRKLRSNSAAFASV